MVENNKTNKKNQSSTFLSSWTSCINTQYANVSITGEKKIFTKCQDKNPYYVF